jgi:cytoskeletal protein RodZ
MFEFLEKMRSKPEGTKKWFAFSVAFCFAGTILVVWLTVIMPDFSAQEKQKSAALASEPSPLATFGTTLSSGFSAIGDQIAGLKTAASSISTGLQNYTASSTAASVSTPVSTSASTSVDSL